MLESIRTVTLGVVLALAVLATPSLSVAGPITEGDGWHQFSWKGGPNVTQTESAYTFTSVGAVTVNVTDAYVAGDKFELYDNNILVGTTGAFDPLQSWVDSPDAAFAGGFSKGSFALAAGAHSLVLKNIQTPLNYTSGSAFVSVSNTGGPVVSQVPEPGTLALVGMGVAGLAAGRLRRRKSLEAVIA